MLDQDTLVRLGCAVSAFLVIGFLGTRNRRVAGVLLTFPILNGIALLNDAKPFDVANAIYLIVIFNSFLFCIAATHNEWMPPLPVRRLSHLPRGLRDNIIVVVRLLAWTGLWCGAFALTQYRDCFPTGIVLFGLQVAFVVFYARTLWTTLQAPDQTTPRENFFETWAKAFPKFWLNWRSFIRIILFVAAFYFLLYAAKAADDPKWVGMASALPLPGLFALAALSVDTKKKDDLLALRDTILFGPLLVIPFNWSLANIMTYLPRDSQAIRIVALFAFWTLSYMLVFKIVPKITGHIDKWHATRRI